MPTLANLADAQRNHPVGHRPLGEIALGLQIQATELVRVTEIEKNTPGRNLVSATILADMLVSICQYSNVRGWSVDRLIELAYPEKSRSVDPVL